MNSISHQQAHECIQVQLDGLLDEEKTFALSAHLRDCAACRAYAVRLKHLDSELRHGYRERALAQQPVLGHELSTDSAIHKRMRLKMKSKQIMNTATSFSLITAVVMVTFVFSWLISTRGHVILPGTGDNPVILPTFTPTPFPWTEGNPLTSTDQIEAILNDLANRNVNAFQQSAWVHIVSRDMAQLEMLRSSHIDSWSRSPKEGQTCIESLTLVKDQPESDTYNQIQVVLSDGRFGDLIQLRNREGQVSQYEPGLSGCSLTPELTSAGQFAIRLKEEQAALQNEQMEVTAWYGVLNERVVFTVSATFTQPSKANATGIMKESRSFDTETGVIVQEGVRWEWEDGSLFGESLKGDETEFLSELPEDVAVQYEQYISELRTYTDGTIVSPTATIAQEGEPTISLNDLSYVEENPLVDGQTILQILRALKQHQIERLSEPGWYVYGPATPDPDDWMSNRYLLTHTVDQDGACEYMSYYIKDGAIRPQEMVLADGRWGLIGVVDGGEVSMGETGKINWSNGPMTDTCLVQNTETVSFIQNETDYVRDLVDGKMQGIYKAWTEEIGDRRLFVLYYEIIGDGLGHLMDPDTRKLEPIERSRTWVYFDLDWGTVLFEEGEHVYTLQNGKTIGSAPTANKTIDIGYTYYKDLPIDLKEAYENTVAKLESYLKK